MEKILKSKIDFVTLSPLLLLILLPIGAFLSPSFTRTAAHPEVALLKYFSIPLIGLSFGGVLFLGIVRNDWKPLISLSAFTDRYWRYIILIVSCIFLLYFSLLAVLRYTTLHTSVGVMGVYDKKIWAISIAPLSSILHEASVLHFQPLLVLYSLIYKIYDSPVIILILQPAVIISGVVPLYLLAKKHINSNGLILFIIIIYLLYPPVGFNAASDFYPDHIYIPLMLWAFYFAENENYIKAVIFAGIAGLAKEPLILGAAFFGLYLIFAKKRFWFGAFTFVFFFSLFIIIVYMILPRVDQTYVSQAGGFGAFPFLQNRSIKPILDTLLEWKIRKLLFLYFLLAPLLFLPVLDWKRFLPAMPFLAIPILSVNYLHSAVDGQYTAGVVPPAFIALIFFLKTSQERYGLRFLTALTILIFTVTLSFNIAHSAGPLSISFWKAGWAEIWHRSNFISSEHEEIIKEAIHKIYEDPEKAVVSPNNINYARLAHRYRYWIFPDRWEDADYILLDLHRPLMIYGYADENKYKEELRKIINSPNFQKVFERDGVLLFKRIEKGMIG